MVQSPAFCIPVQLPLGLMLAMSVRPFSEIFLLDFTSIKFVSGLLFFHLQTLKGCRVLEESLLSGLFVDLRPTAPQRNHESNGSDLIETCCTM